MFKDWSGQSASSIVSVLCGFITVLSGTMVLHWTREPDRPSATGIPIYVFNVQMNIDELDNINLCNPPMLSNS
uniref:Magnesium transporter n=1 Tax=Kalanchoe fedtschenkoi TaxID=63787 RepID=A0A7N0TSF3_KALFE